jgi:hypothetical protein
MSTFFVKIAVAMLHPQQPLCLFRSTLAAIQQERDPIGVVS